MAQAETGSQEWIDRIEELVHRAEVIEDPEGRGIAVDLLQAVLTYHGAALERMLEITADSGVAGEAIIDRIAADDLTSSVLLLHGLHPDDLETRLNHAIEKLEERFALRISLLSTDDGVVRLRAETDRAAWSGAPIKASIEAAIYQAAPEIASVIVEGFHEPPSANFVPLSNLLAGVQV